MKQSVNQSINQPSDQSINPAIICVHASWFRGRKIPRRCSRSLPDFEQLPHRRLLRRQEAWRGPTDVRVYKTCRVVMPLSQSLCLWPLPHTHTQHWVILGSTTASAFGCGCHVRLLAHYAAGGLDTWTCRLCLQTPANASSRMCLGAMLLVMCLHGFVRCLSYLAVFISQNSSSKKCCMLDGIGAIFNRNLCLS